MLQETLKFVLPPFLFSIRRSIQSVIAPKQEEHLFDGSDALFKTLAVGCDYYAEYGCGQSTSWMLRNTRAQIYSVDSDNRWLDKVRQDNPSHGRLHGQWIDLGDVGNWGQPLSYEKADSFCEYTDWIWQQPRKPDLVLIDGRFRVCSFATCLKYANPGTRIVFDDYVNRPRYHIIERLLTPTEICGRQALFVVPSGEALDFETLEQTIAHFRFVTE